MGERDRSEGQKERGRLCEQNVEKEDNTEDNIEKVKKKKNYNKEGESKKQMQKCIK